jgi:NAD(P)-dependent dehydrogenase (short-subunit alcohol dehydrogenase family)
VRLEHKVAVITGAGSGIGECTARLFAQEGCAVVVVDRDEASARRVKEAICLAGGRAKAVLADVSRREEAQRMADETLSAFGRVDILYNNAGTEQQDMPLVETPDEVWDHVINVNARTVLNCCRAVIPQMMRQGGGSVVNASSMLALIAAEGQGAYAASKAAVAQLTKVLALEHARHNIRVNAVCATMVRTPMADRYLASVEDRDAWIRDLEHMIPLGRLGVASDVAAAVLFLASDEASFITGVCLPIDGGVLVK